MTFQIFIDDSQVSSMEGPYGAVSIIPFTGKVESEIFTGEILPGAADVQVENVAGSRNMCAKYMFRGKDSRVLGEYLCQKRFRSEVQGRDWGVEIRIYDVLG